MTTMRAARLIKPGEPLRIEDIEVPSPGPGEVLVEVAVCGLCGTDLHLAVDGDIPVAHTPITLGHEGAGTVAAVGPDAGGVKEGDRVVLFPAATCGSCRFCLAGRQSLCEASRVYGMAQDGALADYVIAPARAVIALPPSIPFEIGAIVTDGVSTPFHALRARGRLRAGESVAVVGCGGLGTHAIMLARLMGASRVVALDTDAVARQRALDLGADLALDPSSGDAVKEMRAHLGARGVDLALECIGLPETVELALRLLDTAGRAVVVGVGMGRAKLPPLIAFVGREHSVIGSFGMDRADIADLFALIVAGRLDLSASISARYPLEGVNDALRHLADKTGGVVRIVVELGR